MRIARACVENDRPPGGLVDGNVLVPQIPVEKNRLQRSPLRFQWSEKPGDDLAEPLLPKLPHFFIGAVGALFHVECVGKASGEGLLQAVAVRKDQWVLPAIHGIRQSEFPVLGSAWVMHLNNKLQKRIGGRKFFQNINERHKK